MNHRMTIITLPRGVTRIVREGLGEGGGVVDEFDSISKQSPCIPEIQTCLL